MITPNFTLIIPELFLLIMASVILMASVFVTKGGVRFIYSLSQLTLVALFACIILFVPDQSTTTFHGTFVIDHFAIVQKLFMVAITFLAFIYAKKEVLLLDLPSGEYFVLCLFSLLGMFILVSASNMLTVYLGIELLSLPLYALVAINKKAAVGTEAAIKYFVTGALASGLLLYGISLIYGVTKSLDLTVIATNIAALPESFHWVMLVGIVFVIAGLSFKLGLVPFHMWVPDVYQGAPVSMALFIGSVPKIAAFGVIVRVLFEGLVNYYQDWFQFLILLAFVSMMFGNLLAIAQTNIKRMLGFSSIAHMGYLSLGLIAGTPQGMGAALFYVIMYALMAAGAFGVIVMLNRAGLEIETLDDFRGLNARSPWLALMMLLIMFSMAGVPPTVGFIAKFGVITALVKVHLVWLAVAALVFAIVGAYYYLRIVKLMYFEAPKENTPITLLEYPDVTAAITVNGLLILFLGVFPGLLIDVCRASFAFLAS